MRTGLPDSALEEANSRNLQVRAMPEQRIAKYTKRYSSLLLPCASEGFFIFQEETE